jgi:hypothetical protein
MLSSRRAYIKKGQPDQTTQKEETTPDCPAMMPCGSGTTPSSEGRYPAVLDLQMHLHHPHRRPTGLYTMQRTVHRAVDLSATHLVTDYA